MAMWMAVAPPGDGNAPSSNNSSILNNSCCNSCALKPQSPTTIHKNELIIGIVSCIEHVANLIATPWCVMAPDICSASLA